MLTILSLYFIESRSKRIYLESMCCMNFISIPEKGTEKKQNKKMKMKMKEKRKRERADPLLLPFLFHTLLVAFSSIKVKVGEN